LTRTGRKEAFDVLGLLKKYSARVRGFRWAFNAVQDQDRWLEIGAGDRMTFEPGELEILVEQTHAQLPAADEPQNLDASLKLTRLELSTGEQLLQLAKALGVEVKASEVTQK
jgi:hypothetical protein